MSGFVHHEPCPRCGSRDNLARYMDGSAWCFGCHYRERANRIPVVNEKWLEKEEDAIVLDDDLCYNYPVHVVSWLAKYGITVEEAIKHGWKYGPKRDQLVFIFKDEAGNISCTQARNFWEGSKRKYFNQGAAQQTLPIFRGPHERDVRPLLVIVEDAVSAAKIARQCDAMPCLGSYLPKNKQNALRLLGYEELVVWLDADKLKEAREIADQAKWLGFKTKVVYTERDPKEYDNSEIQKLLR
jgi:hypothetical protein